MSLDDFDEWDTTFLENFIEQEERIIAVSSINPTQSHNYKQQHQQKQPVVILDAESPPPPSMPSSQLPFAASHFSPPRELSQRFTDCRDYEHSSNGNAINALGLVPSFRHGRKEKDSETDNLKTELRRIRKQLTQLEQECVVLKKERDNKEAQLSSAFSQIDAKDVEINLLKRKNVGYESLIQDQSQNLPEHHAHVEQAALSNDGVALETCKAIGVQTEASRDFSHSTIKNNSPLDHDLSKKLLAIWGSPSGQRLEKNLVSRLFATCASDFWILFGCMSMNKPSTVILEASPRKSFYDMTLHDNKQAVHSVDAAKVSRLYTMLTKISNNMVQLDAFLGALLDLCILENVVVAHRSLCILRMILLQLPTYEGSSKSVLYPGITSWSTKLSLLAMFWRYKNPRVDNLDSNLM